MEVINKLRHGITHLFYPRLCEGCSKPLLPEEQVLCMGCALQLPETNFHIGDNEATLRLAGRVPFIYATSLAYFTNEGLLQHLLHGLKYRGKKEIGHYLGRRLGQYLLRMQPETFDMVIPVPLHKNKKAKRGYNQSMLIAEGISEVLGIPASEDILLRVRNTESQTQKTRSERVSNMQEAFCLRNKEALTGKHILLCDDVLTTGATIEACALTLIQEQSIKISVATIGIAIS